MKKGKGKRKIGRKKEVVKDSLDEINEREK